MSTRALVKRYAKGGKTAPSWRTRRWHKIKKYDDGGGANGDSGSFAGIGDIGGMPASGDVSGMGAIGDVSGLGAQAAAVAAGNYGGDLGVALDAGINPGPPGPPGGSTFPGVNTDVNGVSVSGVTPGSGIGVVGTPGSQGFGGTGLAMDAGLSALAAGGFGLNAGFPGVGGAPATSGTPSGISAFDTAFGIPGFGLGIPGTNTGYESEFGTYPGTPSPSVNVADSGPALGKGDFAGINPNTGVNTVTGDYGAPVAGRGDLGSFAAGNVNTPGGFNNEFGEFTSIAPGVTATGVNSDSAVNAFADVATGPTPNPATSGIQSVVADDNSNSFEPGALTTGHGSITGVGTASPTVTGGINPAVAVNPSLEPDTTPTTTSPQPSLTQMEQMGVFGTGISLSNIAAVTGLPVSDVSAALSNAGPNPEAQRRVLAELLAQANVQAPYGGAAAKGGRIGTALSVARRYAKGGRTKHEREPQDHEFHDFASGGLINSSVPGRTDKLPLKVKSGAYVIPASVVSGLGEGNTQAGVAALDRLFGMGPYGAKSKMIATPHVNYGRPLRPIAKLRAAGGGAGNPNPVKIIAAGGEVVIPPDIVKNLGGGDMNHGHDILDELVKHVRAQTIKDMKNEKPPKRD